LKSLGRKIIITTIEEDFYRAERFLLKIVDNSFKRLLEEMKKAKIAK